MRPARLLVALALVLLGGGTAAAEGKAENPEFTNWSKFKKGTSVTLKSTTAVAGMTNETTITTTLVDVGTDKLTVEMSTVAKVNGMEFKTPPMKRDIAKTVTLPKGVKDVTVGKKPEGSEEGTETLKIGGTEFKAKWYKTKVKVGGNEVESKVWVCDDMPGGLVKTETTSTGANAVTTKMEVTEVKKP